MSNRAIPARSCTTQLEVALWRPGVPILALFQPTLTGDGVSWNIRGRAEARRALLLRSVLPILADPRDGLNEDAMLASALKVAEKSGLVAKGDFVCLSHKCAACMHRCDALYILTGPRVAA